MNDQPPGDEIEKDATDNQEQGNKNTLTIVLAVALLLALAAIAFLLIANVFDDADSGSEGGVVPPTEIAPPPAEEPADLPLEGTDWILAGTMEGTTISLRFAGDSLSGSAGCNSYNASYRSTRAAGSSNNISVGTIASSQAMCDEPIMNQEQGYLTSLASASSYTISGSTLTLTTDSAPLTFAAAQATLLPAQ